MTAWPDARLDHLRTLGDQPADAAVAAHFAERPAQAPVDLVAATTGRRSIAGVADSAPLTDFLRAPVELPRWARVPGSAELVRAGQDVFALYGLQIGSALFCASLPEGYAAPAIARTLWATARLTDEPRRRVAETAQFLVDTMEHGGLEPGRPGYESVRRVRLMHAAVRHHATAAEPGLVAVNQEELLGTLMTFTWVPFTAIERFGLPLSDADRAAYLHCWNVIGFLIGVEPEVLPLTLADMAELEGAFRRRYQRSGEASEPGVLLTDALVTMMQGYLPAWLWLLRGMPATTIRHLIGEEVADLTAVPLADWTRVLYAPLADAARRVRLGPPGLWAVRRVATTFGRRLLAEFARRESRGERPAFAVPDQLARTWKLHRLPTRPPADPAASGHVADRFRPPIGRTAFSVAQSQ